MGVHFILYPNKAVFKVCTMSFAKSWCVCIGKGCWAWDPTEEVEHWAQAEGRQLKPQFCPGQAASFYLST